MRVVYAGGDIPTAPDAAGSFSGSADGSHTQSTRQNMAENLAPEFHLGIHSGHLNHPNWAEIRQQETLPGQIQTDQLNVWAPRKLTAIHSPPSAALSHRRLQRPPSFTPGMTRYLREHQQVEGDPPRVETRCCQTTSLQFVHLRHHLGKDAKLIRKGRSGNS